MKMSFNLNLQRKSGMWITVFILVLISIIACGAASSKDNKHNNGPMIPSNYNPQISLAPLVEQVSPAVVNIRTTHNVSKNFGRQPPESLFNFFFGQRGQRGQRGQQAPVPEQQQRAMGSGFIIDSSGLVVTNHHVVKHADEIEVQLADERTFKAKLVGWDERTDLALLKIEDGKKLPMVTFGNSDTLKVGDHVVAIGNPFGLDHTVTAGIVSAKERVIGAGPYDDFIQTDASINPGNSGGPLFNLRGEVVGINTAIVPRGQGIGFAIPSTLANNMITSLKNKGRVIRGWLGIVPQPLDKTLAKVFGVKNKEGALVANVQPDSPADKAGVRAGDVILKIGGRKLKTSRQIYTEVASLKPGAVIPFHLLRNGKKKTIKIKIGEHPDGKNADKSTVTKEASPSELGIRVKPLSSNAKRNLRAEELSNGVIVSRVDPKGPAAKTIKAGDIIVEINRDKVSDIAHFNQLTEKTQKGDDLLLLIFRKGAWIYTVIRL